MQVTLVHNPSAGSSQYGRDELRNRLQRAGHSVKVIDLQTPGEASIGEVGDVVMVAGGDGTVRAVAARLRGSGVPIAILPLGTANNIANSLGLTANPNELIDQLETMPRRVFDVGCVSGVWGDDIFLEGLGFSPFVRSARLLSDPSRTEEFPRPEDELMRDRTVIEQMVWNYAAQTCSLTLDEETLSGTFVAVHVLNLPQIGPNLILSPGGDPRDGYLDVVAVSEVQRADFAAFVAHRRDSRFFNIIRTRHVHMRWEGAEIHVDDQIRETGVPTELRASVAQGQLTFLSP